ncbi:hypothetical protein [Corynebacterium guangdongense]|uniref:Uncharacterized protein n=1 Tax=Corynebacterium guangdongense TaxID=1783348 RepID=A0ABU1ZUR8_9CORY|nr:hypothetical protein [Corynebacterium guangdongense]MDR7328676.1 hypothetical protein [Corynebacterium guangdongense]WJZ17253.1 hypothetical protein CGUA_03285 [Corynebacterium guangdongense]
MATYDSIINVEEWISDHYLTTDETKGESYGKRVTQRVKEWKDDEAESDQPSPHPAGLPGLAGTTLSRSQLSDGHLDHHGAHLSAEALRSLASRPLRAD